MKKSVVVNAKLALDFLSFLRVQVDEDFGDLNILALQGIAPTSKGCEIELNDNAPNIYNDSIVILFRDALGAWNAVPLLGTVDPGDAFKDQPGGEAHLTFGQHQYVRGLHYGYPALRSKNEMNRIWRDANQLGVYAPGDYVSTGVFGINVHAGGMGPTIGNWSAGCVNICGGWDGNPWKLFMRMVDIHFQRRDCVGLTVWSGKDFCLFADKGSNFRPTLRYGILNPWVGELQKLLKLRGLYYKGPIDNDWRDGVEVAVRSFQMDHDLQVDGIVGSRTWELLGACT
jgi:hypothetical protein